MVLRTWRFPLISIPILASTNYGLTGRNKRPGFTECTEPTLGMLNTHQGVRPGETHRESGDVEPGGIWGSGIVGGGGQEDP